MNNNTSTAFVDSPVGWLFLRADAVGLREIRFVARPKESILTLPEEGEPRLAPFIAALSEYFAGTRKHFDLPLAPEGTPFQMQVWNELRKIPYGETISYGELARRIGRPAASRAVGGANHRNPLPIVIPCHRVIGSNGSMTGYGGGIYRKEYLLRLEGCELPGESGEPDFAGKSAKSICIPMETF
jgi:methylated-DNA-[protein]-cysteine S-methyltransferase